MLHDWQQFHVRIAHFLYVVCQHRRELPVIVEFPAIIRLPPGAEVQLIDRHRIFLGLRLFPVCHPLLISPGKFGQICDDRCRIRAKLRRIRIRVCLQISQATFCFNLILI